MDSITQFFISEYDNVLNIGFVCNIMIFCAVLDALSDIVSSLAAFGRK